MKTHFHPTLFLLLCLLLAIPVNSSSTGYTEPGTGIRFVLIKGGAFDMGDPYNNGYEIERPLHRVIVVDFYMSATEVTFAQYDTFCDETGRSKPDDNGWGRGEQPVINVTWQDARDFAAWLSQRSKRKVRLPSEAEWEFAARGGRGTEYWWGNAAGLANANCADCGSRWDGKRPAPVASFSANPYGLFDMNGNVYEWCADDRHDNYSDAPADGRAWIDSPPAQEKITRSGSFLMPAFESRARARSWDSATRSGREQGIRLVMEP
jgi:formylglycine-generating enzyme required for sulfatase activity